MTFLSITLFSNRERFAKRRLCFNGPLVPRFAIRVCAMADET
jgi:hypothetical protein